MAMQSDAALEATSEQAAQEALEHIHHLADGIGPRPVGSEADAEAARYVHDRLMEAGVPELRRQEFVAPRTLWMPYAIASAAAIFGLVLWVLAGGTAFGAYLGALGCGFALWEIYAELNFGWSPLAALVPRARSHNVFCSFAPTEGEGRNAIVFAHMDTQRTPVFSRSRTGLRLWLVLFYVSFAILLLTLVALVAAWFTEQSLPVWLVYPALSLAAITLILMVHADLTPFTRGANDNASAVGVALALARHYVANPLRNTRLWIVFTSGEEAGCHGASAFLQEHGENLMQAYVLALEGLGCENPTYSLSEGMLRTYRSNSEWLRLAGAVAREQPALGLRPVKLRGGYTEAGLAVKRGYRSLCLLGLDRSGSLPYRHSPEDTAARIRPQALAASYSAALALLQRLDERPVSIRLSRVKPLSQRG